MPSLTNGKLDTLSVGHTQHLKLDLPNTINLEQTSTFYAYSSREM